MKRYNFKYIYLSLLCGCMLAGCADHDHDPDYGEQAEGTITVVLRVPLAYGGDTRANPEGGEDGNGREQGILHENDVHDVNVFFFKGIGFSPDDADNVSVAGVYVPTMNEDGITEEELPFEKKITIKINSSTTSLVNSGLLSAGTVVSFVTVINAGEDLGSKITTLSGLRAYKDFGKTWTPTEGSLNASGCDRFVMTTAYDTNGSPYVEIGAEKRKVGAGILVKNTANETDAAAGKAPAWEGETTVQRLCARIDVMHKDNLSDDNAELVYKVKGIDNTDNTVHITNMLPVNVMSQPSYLLTMTTQGIPTSWTEAGLGIIKWGGVETTTGNNVPANYVIEPNTLLKESSTTASSLLSTWYGLSATASVSKRIKDATLGKVSDYFTGDIEAANNLGNDHTTIVGYANENVQSKNGFDSRFLTGIVFRALYQPRKWWRKSEGNFIEETKSDAAWIEMPDKGFTRYQPTMKYNDGGEAVSITDEQAMYFVNQADAEEYARLHPEEQAIITRFEGGVCYYNLWLRHYDDVNDVSHSDPHERFDMEYATVRNNIYRVALTFTGPGDPTPFGPDPGDDPDPKLREPDTMMARIFVRKWNLREEKTPLVF